MPLEKVAKLSDIPEGRGLAVTVGDHQIAIFNLGAAGLRAIDNQCPHAATALADGRITDRGTVRCPGHRWEFSLDTGACMTLKQFAVKAYAVTVQDDEVFVSTDVAR